MTIRPLAPKPSLFIDPPVGGPETEELEAFIPPPAERPQSRAPRMPRIDELPMPAQNEIRAKRGEVVREEHPVGQRMTLLQRLASVGGLGRRHHEEEPDAEPESPEHAATGRAPCRPAGAASARTTSGASIGIRQASCPSGLDQHGRQSPVHNPTDEDQLDIPAFLRRQAN